MEVENEIKKPVDVNESLYQEVTNKIIKILENGILPWRKTWSSFGLARNYLSGHIYTGINFILMNNTGRRVPYYLTYNQVKKGNGKIKAGSQSERVYYFNIIYKDNDGNSLSEADALLLLKNKGNVSILKFIKYYNVFNVEDIEGIDFDFSVRVLNEDEKIIKCDEIIENMINPPVINIHDGKRLFYIW